MLFNVLLVQINLMQYSQIVSNTQQSQPERGQFILKGSNFMQGTVLEEHY